jgi:hypothetical protein
MKTTAKFLTTLGLFVTLILIAGCTKDNTDPAVVAGQLTITSTFTLMPDGTSSQSVLAHVTWTTENAVMGTLDGNRISLPTGDTTLTMKKGDKKTCFSELKMQMENRYRSI